MSSALHLAPSTSTRFRAFTPRDLDGLLQRVSLSATERLALRAVSSVLPFRTNTYVVDELIDWSAVPDDPIFRLTFPQAGMLPEPDLKQMADLLSQEAPKAEVLRAAHEIRMKLNPHPSGQLDANVPVHEGERLEGLQHKYPETVLIFPRQGQTCHAYCTYCFRWPQFVGESELRIATDDIGTTSAYLKAHPEVTSALITGGDPLVMSTEVLRRYVDPLLEIDTIRSIRIGTKSLAFWPYRFTTDRDADDLLRLFEKVVASGRHLALMAHFTHPQELRPPVVRDAMRRVRSTGAVIRCQGPLVAADQRQCRGLGRAVGRDDHARRGAVLPVRGARHRAPGLLRRPAGPRPPDLPRRLRPRLRPRPHGPRPGHVRDAGQGLRRRHCGDHAARRSSSST